jgi:hypothetical protein
MQIPDASKRWNMHLEQGEKLKELEARIEKLEKSEKKPRKKK